MLAVERNAADADALAARLAERQRIFLAGMGTSHHAALAGEHLIRAYGGGCDVRAWHSFDFALYGPRLSSEDYVIAVSHRGKKRYSVEAVERARVAGCGVSLITGEGDMARLPETEFVLQTVAQEISSAHTVSYTGAVAILALIATHLGYDRAGSHPLSEGFLNHELPGAMKAGLHTERAVADLARKHSNHRRIWFTGAGPCAAIASEAALKIKETSFQQAEGMPIETFLHGPFQCTESEDLFVLLAPQGPGQARVLEMIPLIRELGAPYIVVSDGSSSEGREGAAGWITVPQVPEPFTALTCLIPLQLFSYYLALVRGTNPDTFRVEDPRFARFSQIIKL